MRRGRSGKSLYGGLSADKVGAYLSNSDLTIEEAFDEKESSQGLEEQCRAIA